MTPIQQYIMRIGNRPQQRYAQNYYDALKGGRVSQGVDGPGTSHVMRQATRMAIDEMWEKEFGVRPPPAHEPPMRHAAKVEVTMKASAMKIGQTKVVAEDVSKIIEDLIKTEWSGSAEETGRAVSLMKGLAFSDDPKAKKFMQAVDKFTSGLDPKQFV